MTRDSVPHPTAQIKYGGWLPSSPNVITDYHKTVIHHADSKLSSKGVLNPCIERFGDTIKSHPELIDLFDQAVIQSDNENKIISFQQFLFVLDKIVSSPPKFHLTEDLKSGKILGEPVGVPIGATIDLLANCVAGYDLFRSPIFNRAVKEHILDPWGKFLASPESTKTLTTADEGWFGQHGIADLEAKDRGSFDNTYIIPDPKAPHKGFRSWDDFFTRKYNPSARPIHNPDDNSLIHSACESTVYRISRKVKKHDHFWLKGQPYSLYDMFNHDEELGALFDGGTVYQAFLSPQDYHRWHAPTDGVIVDAFVIPGTYFAVLPDDGPDLGDPNFHKDDPHGVIVRSQAWLTMNATRAVIIIKSSNPDISTMAFIGVGMVEVSSCEIKVKRGDKIKIGDELGLFHFGGSSHALVFPPDIDLSFADHVTINQHLKVNSIIAQVKGT